jgi:shikimate 5-dehydrogenase
MTAVQVSPAYVYSPSALISLAFIANGRGSTTYQTYPGGAGGSGRVIISYLAQKGISVSLISNSTSSSLTGGSGIVGSDGLIHIYQFTNSTTAQVAAITAPIVVNDRTGP